MRIQVRAMGGTSGPAGEYRDFVWGKLEAFFRHEGWSQDYVQNARRLIEIMVGRRTNELDEAGALAAVRWCFERDRGISLGFFLESECPTMVIEACAETPPTDPHLCYLRRLILAMWRDPEADAPEEKTGAEAVRVES